MCRYLSRAILLIWPLTALAQPPVRMKLIPTTFSHSFTTELAPVLKIRPGDTVETEMVDAMGVDQKNVRRIRGGNPLTGPFLVEGAMPGDVLVVRLIGVSLNRDYAHTTDYLASRSMPKEVLQDFRKSHLVKWKIDRQNNMAWIDSAAFKFPHLANFKIPVAPMIGCIGVAPGKGKGMLSFFQGPFGGNMDYNRITKGALVYLPVFIDGAYFYIGDGHAIEGDGEIAGNALETSMDVTFCIQLIKHDSLSLSYPRVEDQEYIMALGMAKETPDAIKNASGNLLDWLQKDYKLDVHEAAQVMSTTVEYTIAEIADPQVVVAAKIRKEKLSTVK